MTAALHNPAEPAASQTTSPAPPRVRVAIEYAVSGDLRFISHRDEMRVLGRALLRAAWPLRYSRGFNPSPFLSIALPRSTGMASLCQVALIDLSASPPEASPLVERLAATLPAGMPLRRMFADDVPPSLHPRLVTYECDLPPEQAELLAPRLQCWETGEPLLVARAGAAGRPAAIADARPFIETLEFQTGMLRLRLRFDGERSARPIDILKTLGLSAEECGHRLRRVEVVWNETLAGREFRPAAAGPAEDSPAPMTLAECRMQPAATEKRDFVD